LLNADGLIGSRPGETSHGPLLFKEVRHCANACSGRPAVSRRTLTLTLRTATALRPRSRPPSRRTLRTTTSVSPPRRGPRPGLDTATDALAPLDDRGVLGRRAPGGC
jgi:hypothetical protein